MSSTLTLTRKRYIDESTEIYKTLKQHGYHNVIEITELVYESPSFFELDLFIMGNAAEDFLDRDTLILLHHELSEILTKGTKEDYDIDLDRYNFDLNKPDVLETLQNLMLTLERALADNTLTGLYYS